MLNYSIVIPARMASQRLPRKPVLEIAGRTLIEHVYRRALCSRASRVVIATDDAQIFEIATGFGAQVLMTSRKHESGSDRIAECADLLSWDDDHLLVNLQGDEPLMPAACLDQLAKLLDEDSAADVASLYWPLEDDAEIENPNAVKVVVNQHGHALYFSRAVIPHARGLSSTASARAEGVRWNRHIGLYAYRVGALRAFAELQPTPLESAEKLEQLRFLETGRVIRMAQACEYIPAGVDTPEDLERVRKLIGE